MAEKDKKSGLQGHRQRVKERFAREGLHNFTDLDVLELLLFYAQPRRDTRDTARQLLDQFGTLEAVMKADTLSLYEIPGVGPETAALLHLIPELSARFMREREVPKNKRRKLQLLNSSSSSKKYIESWFVDRTEEALVLFCLDAQLRLRGELVVAEGNANAVALDLRKIIRFAMARNATAALLAHNHPGGTARPSPEDREVTRRVAEALKTVDITLVDHVIITEGEAFSFAEEGLI